MATFTFPRSTVDDYFKKSDEYSKWISSKPGEYKSRVFPTHNTKDAIVYAALDFLDRIGVKNSSGSYLPFERDTEVTFHLKPGVDSINWELTNV